MSSGPNIFGQESGARLAVAVLARERAAEAENQIGGALDEFAEAAEAFAGAEVEVRPQMRAALAIVAVDRGAVAVLVHQSGEAAQISAELRGRNGSVFPAFAAVRLAGNEDSGAERGVADAPDAGGVGRRIDARGGRCRQRPTRRGQGFRLWLALRLHPTRPIRQAETRRRAEAMRRRPRQGLSCA